MGDNVKCLHVAFVSRISGLRELVGRKESHRVIALTFCSPKVKARMIFPPYKFKGPLNLSVKGLKNLR